MIEILKHHSVGNHNDCLLSLDFEISGGLDIFDNGTADLWRDANTCLSEFILRGFHD